MTVVITRPQPPVHSAPVMGTTMKIASDSGDFVELTSDPNEVGPDLAALVRVRRGRFTGESHVWIARADWFAFSQDLTVLEERRQGRAHVQSMSPGELSLTVRSIDSTGHVGVEGHLGVREFDTEVQLTFSCFSFDPSQLVSAARQARELSAALG